MVFWSTEYNSFVLQSPRELCFLFASSDSSFCIYHSSVSSLAKFPVDQLPHTIMSPFDFLFVSICYIYLFLPLHMAYTFNSLKIYFSSCIISSRDVLLRC